MSDPVVRPLDDIVEDIVRAKRTQLELDVQVEGARALLQRTQDQHVAVGRALDRFQRELQYAIDARVVPPSINPIPAPALEVLS